MTPKQERFIREYLIDLNATQAAKRAGYHPKMAAKLVAQSSIQDAIAKGRQRLLDVADITAERTMLELGRIAFSDRRDVWSGGRLKPFDEWTPDQAAALEGFEVIVKNAQAGDGHTDTVHKVKLTGKIPALDLLAKHFGLVTNKLHVDGELKLKDLILAASQPA